MSSFTVSWQHGSSNPSGEVAEKVTEGEASVQSKRGNTIKRKAEPENPAVHLLRPGNDVVKNQNELTVEEKNGDEDDEPGEAPGEASEEAPKTGDKRAADDEAEEEPSKKAKVGRGRPKKVGGTTDAGVAKKKNATEKKSTAASAKTTSGEADPNKKGRGRPKKEEGSGTLKPKAPKKEKKPRAAPNGTGVGSRTRSAKK